jgi:hypothetical protein
MKPVAVATQIGYDAATGHHGDGGAGFMLNYWPAQHRFGDSKAIGLPGAD